MAKLAFFRGNLFSAFGAAEGYIQKEKYNQKKGKGNLYIGINIGKIHNDSLSANRKATSKHTIAPATSIVNTTLLEDNDRSEKFGNINAAPIQPAARLVNKPESTLNLDLENNLINYNLTKDYVTCQRNGKTIAKLFDCSIARLLLTMKQCNNETMN